jgi:hypothetical protein
MGLAEDIMGKTEEKKADQPKVEAETREIPVLDDKGNPTGKTQVVDAHTGFEYNPGFEQTYGKRKSQPRLARGIVYDDQGKPVAGKTS